MKLADMIGVATAELRAGRFWSGCLRGQVVATRGRQAGVTRIAAELGVTKGHVSRCLRGERFSGRVARAAGRRAS